MNHPDGELQLTVAPGPWQVVSGPGAGSYQYVTLKLSTYVVFAVLMAFPSIW
jgi:hypothetical protein